MSFANYSAIAAVLTGINYCNPQLGESFRPPELVRILAGNYITIRISIVYWLLYRNIQCSPFIPSGRRDHYFFGNIFADCHTLFTAYHRENRIIATAANCQFRHIGRRSCNVKINFIPKHVRRCHNAKACCFSVRIHSLGNSRGGSHGHHREHTDQHQRQAKGNTQELFYLQYLHHFPVASLVVCFVRSVSPTEKPPVRQLIPPSKRSMVTYWLPCN